MAHRLERIHATKRLFFGKEVSLSYMRLFLTSGLSNAKKGNHRHLLLGGAQQMMVSGLPRNRPSVAWNAADPG